MRRRNLQSMGHGQNDPRQRGTWTPFVGVALAVLTAGSLVVFSLVAQRTSLDGFSARGVTALAPSQETPGSITLPGYGPATGPGSSDEGPAGAALLTLSPPSPSALLDGSSGPTADTVGAAAPTAGADVATGPTGARSPIEGSLARLDDGGPIAQLFRDGRDGDTEASAARGKADGKNKGRDKGKQAKGDKEKSTGKGRGHGLSADRRKERGHKKSGGAQGASHRSSRSDQATAPRPSHSSRPAQASRPQPAAKPKPRSKPKSTGHSNTSGKGHSKDKGRGHTRD